MATTTTTDPTAILTKIQNLLNMTTANGCTESEAANAANLAQKLLTQHKLSMTDVMKGAMASGEAKAVESECQLSDTVSTAWANGIAKTVGQLTYTKAYGRGNSFFFVGYEVDAKVATALMDHFMGHGAASMNEFRESDWKAFKKANPKTRYNGIRVRSEFLYGYGVAIATRLKTQLAERDKEAQSAANQAAVKSSATYGQEVPTTTIYEIVKFSADAIKAWEHAQVTTGGKFKKSGGSVRSGKATSSGYAAGNSAPLSVQSAIA